MRRKRPYKLFTSAVNFDPIVVEYLDKLAAEQDRSRSNMLNQIVREHAQRHGEPLPPQPWVYPLPKEASE